MYSAVVKNNRDNAHDIKFYVAFRPANSSLHNGSILMPGTGTFLLLAFASLVVVLLLVFLQLTRLGFVVRSTIPDRPGAACSSRQYRSL